MYLVRRDTKKLQGAFRISLNKTKGKDSKILLDIHDYHEIS